MSAIAHLGELSPHVVRGTARRVAGRWAVVPPAHLALALVLAGAAALRVALAGRGLDVGEIRTYQQVSDLPLSGLVSGPADAIHPPLYHVLLHATVDVLGDRPVDLRALSIVWSLVAVAAIWAWSREAFPHVTPLPAALLAAFAPFTVWHGTAARPYAQILALVAVIGWLTWRILARGPSPSRVVALFAATVAVLFSHDLSETTIIAVLIVAAPIALKRREDGRPAVAVILVCAAALAVLLGWLLTTRYVPEQSAADAASLDFFSALVASVEVVLGFPSDEVLGVTVAAWPLLCLAAVAIAPHLAALDWRRGGLVIFAAAPMVALACIALAGGPGEFDPAFLVAAAPALYVLAGRALSTLRPRALLLGLLIGIGVALSVWQQFSATNRKLYDLRSALVVINDHAQPGDAVLLTSEGLESVTRYYAPAPGVRVLTADGRLGTAWRRLRASRPPRLYVLGAMSGSSHAFLATRSQVVAHMPFANAPLHVLAPSWDRPR